MGQCLRGKLADVGILPQPAPVVAATDAAAPVAEAPTAISEAEAAAVDEPALDTTPTDDVVAATFGLLRAEPDGSVVIAGSGTPGTELEVYSDDALLGKTTVESSGDWVFVPDVPIAPGGTEITLAETGKSGRAAQSFVVVINDDKSSEPLVVASTPGAASEVLQGLRPVIETDTQLAAADPVAQPPAPVAATPAPTPAYVRPTLRLNSTAEEVTELQGWLISLGYLSGTPSGSYDKATEKAVQSFQKDEGLTADGIAGPKTWARLDAFTAILQGS